jgi:glycine hydroxymethyltransferase
MAVCFAVLTPGDTILGMDLSHGGHLSHGSPLSFSGQLYRAEHYQVNKDSEILDYSEVSAVARRVKPKLIICGASAYPRTIDFKAFREIADEVSAVLLADVAHIAGLIAAGVHLSPVPYADFVTTTTHKTLRGPRGAIIMCKEAHAKALDKAVFPGVQGGPFMNSIAGKAVCFAEAQTTEWKSYQKQIAVNAKAVAAELIKLKFRLVSGGTDNHLMLVDLRQNGMTGKDAEAALAEAGITLNKNTIPFDPQKPFIASGIRIGTPCVTSRGMREGEMKEVAGLISEVLSGGDRAKVRRKVLELCARFPLHELK